MTVVIKDVFDAYPKSTYQVLVSGGATGFYIPPYQRNFSWGVKDINRLFEDSCHGLTKLLEESDSITFIGTLILIHDTKYDTIEPKVRDHLPSAVMHVIDGQQRLSSLLIAFTQLHSEVQKQLSKIQKKKETFPDFQWLISQGKTLEGELRQSFEQQMNIAEDDSTLSTFYPRIIRAFDDQWSASNEKYFYTSPIARYLSKYIEFNRDQGKKKSKFQYSLPNGSENNENAHKSIKKATRRIKTLLNNIMKGGDDDIEMPDIISFLSTPNIQQQLFSSEAPSSLKAMILAEDTESKDRDLILSSFRLFSFAKYLLHSVAFTEVRARNEDYAFEMFEALNTTGTPLTAYETFKPKVVKEEGQAKYENSISRKHLEPVELYLEPFNKAEPRQTATDQLLIPFALYETGIKLTKHLNDQRIYLKKQYENILTNTTEKRTFAQHMGELAIYLQNTWSIDKSKKNPLLKYLKEEDQEEIGFCLGLLRSSGHHITTGLIARFYADWNLEKNLEEIQEEQVETKYNSFIQCIKAVTAFSAIWRGSRSGTDGIDTIYRNLMGQGIPNINVGPFCRRPDAKELPSNLEIDSLKKALRYSLKQGGIESKTDWIKRASKTAIYDESKEFTRFLLLTALHDTIASEKNNGTVELARDNHNLLMDSKAWLTKEHNTIEHIAPQKQRDAEGWAKDIYDDLDLIHTLGNLTVIPNLENIVLGNKSWSDKKLIFQILSETSQSKIPILLEKAKKQGVSIKEKSEDILSNAKDMQWTKSIALCEAEWSAQIIKSRSQNLAELIWNSLESWLDLDEL